MKKLLSNFAIAFLAPILTLSAFLIVQTAILPALSPTAFADTQNWSSEVLLTGQTSAMLVNGVNNSGITDFNLLGAKENLKQYRAKLIKTGEPFTDGKEVYEMRGWAWNDNLGWVSFYCDGNDGTNGQPVKDGTNLGASCGQQTYGVKLKYNYAEGSLSFVGYAWNDATGYISMNSLNGGTVKYGLKVGVKTEAHPDEGAIIGDHQDLGGSATPYAWSQSLTWINFTGVRAEVELVVIPEPVCDETDFVGSCIDICVEGDTREQCNQDQDDGDDDDGDSSTLGIDDLDVYTDPAYPIADGVESYKIKISFKDKDGVPMKKTDINASTIKIFFKWKDTVKRNQMVGQSVGDLLTHLTKPFTKSSGAITYKPIFLYTSSTEIPSSFEGAPESEDIDVNINADNINSSANVDWEGDKLVLKIKSLAPTSGGNKSKVVSMGEKVYRLNDINEERNELILESVQWSLTKDGITITGRTPYTDGGLHLNFRPALEVDTLNTYVKPKSADQPDIDAAKKDPTNDTLVLYRNVATNLEVGAKSLVTGGYLVDKGAPTTLTQLIVEDDQESDFTTIQETLSKNDNRKSIYEDPDGESFDFWDSNYFILTPDLSTRTTDEYTSGVKLRSTISYESMYKPVTYYSNHLPRTDKSIANPVAVIQGTLYGTGTTTQTGVTITEIGDNNVNIVKDTVYENVKKLVRDQNITPATDRVEIGNNITCTRDCKVIPTTNGERIIYVKGNDVVLTNDDNGATDITWNGNTVVVVDGGNLYIDNNLYNNIKVDPDKKLGLVVIRNTGDDLKEAGNIYISPEVTNIQALAVAWGAIFSYDGENKDNTTSDYGNYGEFNWDDDESTMVRTLQKQLIWQGGISSNNTIGGVDESDAYYKTGYQILNKNDPAHLFTARLYDLNYFRYFRKKIDYDDVTGEAIDQNEDGNIDLNDMVIIDPEIFQAKGASPDETNPLYIKYVPPYSKSVIFGKEKSLTF